MKPKFKKRILTNNQRFTNTHSEYRRVYLLNVVLIALFVCCLFFSAIDLLFFKLYTTAALIAITSMLSLLTLYYFHKTDNIKTVTIITLLMLLGSLFALLWVTDFKYFSFCWVYAIIPVVYFLLKRRMANIVTSIYGALLLTYIILNYKKLGQFEFTAQSICNIVGSTICLIMLISYFELSRNDVVISLEKKNKEVESTNGEFKESKDRLQLILDSTAEAIYGIDTNGNCTFCNTRCVNLLGYKNQEELLGTNMHYKIHSKCKDGTLIPIDECKVLMASIDEKSTHADDEVFWRADDTYFDVEYRSYPQYKDGKVIGAVVTFMDITRRRKSDEQIKYLSRHDPFTGLYNRRCFKDFLKKLDTKKNLPISIIFVDVNGLKMTNDIFGHAAGDELIKSSVEILKKVCNPQDIIARMGGDEFVIVLPNTDADKAKMIMSNVRYELSNLHIVAIKCSMSLGSDTKTIMTQGIDQIMANAENEMYKEKTLTRKDINSDIINTIITLLHEKSPREKRHSMEVSELCQKIGHAIKLPETEVKKLGDAGYLHDIGKIVLDDKTINKKVELTEEEEKNKQQHSVVGFRILNLFDDTLNLAEAVYSHHERWDGTGYPKGLKGEEIPLNARIIAVAETFDTMVNDSNKSKEETLEEITKLSGVTLDPNIAGIFVYIMTHD